MKRNNVLKITVVILVSLVWVSCFKDNTSDFEVYSDVFTINKKINDQPMHALAYYVYGNQMMKSATVSRVGGLGVETSLGISPSSVYTMNKEPEASDFKSYQEPAGEYLFKVVSENGVSLQDSDYLNPQNLGIPTITAVSFSSNNKLVEMGWSAVSKADGYVVKIADSTGVYIYAGETLDPETTTYTVNGLLGNWAKPINSGKSYSIQVHAFKFENDADSYYAAYNLEELSIGERKVVWP